MMNKNRRHSLLCLLLVLALSAVTLAGCGSTAAPETTAEAAAAFTVEVTGKDGSTTTHAISTDCATVGEALLAEGLIAGEESEYGLYVTTVDGVTLDWDADGMYWAFYIDGEYATTGVDATEVTPGAVYAFVATQG